MKIPQTIKVYGDTDYRGHCASETVEQITFFNWLELLHPAYFRVALHPKNEGKRTRFKAALERAMGALNTGASDIIIPSCSRTFVCELKRRDHTKSKLTDEQLKYLNSAQELGCFSCVALGFIGAVEAFYAWQKQTG